MFLSFLFSQYVGTLCIYKRSFSQKWVFPPLALITAWNLCLILLFNRITLFWGNKSHSATMASCSSRRLRGGASHAWTLHFGWFHTCSMGLRSEDLADHSIWGTPTSRRRALTMRVWWGVTFFVHEQKVGYMLVTLRDDQGFYHIPQVRLACYVPI